MRDEKKKKKKKRRFSYFTDHFKDCFLNENIELGSSIQRHLQA